MPVSQRMPACEAASAAVAGGRSPRSRAARAASVAAGTEVGSITRRRYRLAALARIDGDVRSALPARPRGSLDWSRWLHRERSEAQGAVALVTGGGGGIGGAVAVRLAAEGAAVVVNDIDEGRAQATVDTIAAAGGSARAVVADVSSGDEVDRLFAEVESSHGRLEILVNNAGLIGQTRHFLDADEEWWRRLIDTNLSSVFHCSLRAARLMAPRRRGAIISTSSGGATRAHRGEVAYDATKGGIEGMTRAMALDLAPYGIRVNAVSPGSINVAQAGTSPTTCCPAGRLDSARPRRRAGRPGRDLRFLASDDSAYITGVVVPVDGGMLAQQRNPQVDIFGLDKFPVVPAADDR